jgi:16S rRNA (cytosine967-C5)-methyltransferase
MLAAAARLVRPGGRLAYATCSVLAEENGAVVAAFADAHTAFRPLPVALAAAQAAGLTEAGRERLSALAKGGHAVQMTPLRTGTDGFFLALFERTA